jgi:hypothetical protein
MAAWRKRRRKRTKMPRAKRDVNIKLKDAYAEIQVYRGYYQRVIATLKKVNVNAATKIRAVRIEGNLAVLDPAVEKEVLILSRDLESALGAFKEQTT